MLKKCLFIGLLAMTQVVHGQDKVYCRIYDENAVPRERVTDFKHALIDIDINPYEGQVSGEVTFQFEVIRPEVDSFWLDAPKVEIAEVLIDGAETPFNMHDDGVAILPTAVLNWGEEHQLVVKYTAHPKRGMYFTGWNDASGKTQKQVWTQGQGTDNRHWFPHFDNLSDKLITETRITFDSKYQILSNGDLKSKETHDSVTTWHYAMSKPHSSYLVMIAIGDYAVDTLTTKNGTLIRNWYYADEPEKVAPTFYKTAELFDFMEEYLGVPYAWKSYSQVPVHDFLYGAMENTGATIFTDRYFVDSTEYKSNNYVFVNAHEFTHQWFGDLITSRSGEGHWLHEGFATYFHTIWGGKVHGQEEGDWMFETHRKIAFSAGEKDDRPIASSEPGSARHYMKSAAVIRMLHDEVGDEVFRKTLNHFLTKYRHQNVSSEDFLRAFQDVAGISLDWFFDQWVYAGGEPALELSVLSDEKSKEALRLEVKQVHQKTETVGDFRLPLPIFWADKNGVHADTVILEGDSVFEFPQIIPKNTYWLTVDPYKHLLVKYNWNQYPVKWTTERTLTSVHYLDRIEAIELLAQQEELGKKEFEAILENESSVHGIATAISKVSDWTKSAELVRTKVFADTSSVIKEAFIRTANWEDQENKALLSELLLDQNNKVVSAALNKVLEQDLLDIVNSEELYERIQSYPDLLLDYAQYLFKSGDKNKAIELFVGLTHPSQPFWVRTDAFEIVAVLDYLDDEIVANFNQGMTSFNWRLRSGAIKSWKEISSESKSAYLKGAVNEGVKALFEANEQIIQK